MMHDLRNGVQLGPLGLTKCQGKGLAITAIILIIISIALLAWLPDFLKAEDYALRQEHGWTTTCGGLQMANSWGVLGGGAAMLGLTAGAVTYCGHYDQPVNKESSKYEYKYSSAFYGVTIWTVIISLLAISVFACHAGHTNRWWVQGTRIFGFMLFGISIALNKWMLHKLFDEFVLHPFDEDKAREEQKPAVIKRKLKACQNIIDEIGGVEGFRQKTMGDKFNNVTTEDCFKELANNCGVVFLEPKPGLEPVEEEKEEEKEADLGRVRKAIEKFGQGAERFCQNLEPIY